jgi:hypothetical protein
MKEESKEANDFDSQDDDKDIKVNEKYLAREEKKRHEEASISIFLRGGALHTLHLPWSRPMQLNQSKKGWNPSGTYDSIVLGPDPVVRETRAGQQQ